MADETTEDETAESETVDYEGLTNDELRELLKDRDLPTSGNKDELVARLELSDAEAEVDPAPLAPAKFDQPGEPEKASPEEIVEAQAKDVSGSREDVADAAAGQPDEDDEVTPVDYRTAGKEGAEVKGPRKRIDESWEEPEPREVGRPRTPADQFDYEVLPDGRRRKLVFVEEDDDSEEPGGPSDGDED